MSDAQKPRAYSYIRFSTPEQAMGDSLRRQTDAARQWAAKHQLELDEETVLDPGRSAFLGANVETGALGAFLADVRSGRIQQGSYLIVESLDRISRDTVRKAARTMEDIVEAGVVIVDLEDNGRLYTKESLDDPVAFLIMAIKFMRGGGESRMKSIRVAGAYEEKRRQAASGQQQSKPFTRMLPAWLRWDDALGAYALIHDRAELVRKVFQWADSGSGQHAIARRLNELKTKPWGRAAFWHRSYVAKLLSNPAVIGTFIPHRTVKERGKPRKRTPLEPIERYWPPAVPIDVFERVSARAATTGARGRNAERAIASIVAGVAKCLCGSTVTRISKGRWVYLGCTRAHAARGLCDMPNVRYADVLEALQRDRASFVSDAPGGAETEELDRAIHNLDAGTDVLADECRELVDEIASGNRSDEVRVALREKETMLRAGMAELRRLQEQRKLVESEHLRARLSELRSALVADPVDIARANAALRASLKSVVINPQKGDLVLHWRHSDHSSNVFFNAGKHAKGFPRDQGDYVLNE